MEDLRWKLNHAEERLRCAIKQNSTEQASIIEWHTAKPRSQEKNLGNKVNEWVFTVTVKIRLKTILVRNIFFYLIEKTLLVT